MTIHHRQNETPSIAQAGWRLLKDERAAEITELALALSLIVVLSIPVMIAIGTKVFGYYTSFSGVFP